VIKVRLYRPFSVQAFFSSLPRSVRRISVLDRTKEAGSVGEPLYLDVVNGLEEGAQEGLSALEVRPLVTGGRYGLSSKDFTPAMVASVFDELTKEKPKNHFTIGINDDVTFTSLAFDPAYDIEPDDVVRSIVFGLGSDGTVSANKNSVKIIGETTDLHAQGYFVYDSKKSGGVTTSHLRFGPRPIRSHYLIRKAGFVACHQYDFLERFDVLDSAAQNAVFLLNSPVPSERVWGELPMQTQETIIEKGLRFFAVDAYAIASRTGMGQRINTIMQTCFFALAGILPREEAIGKIKDAIRKSYSTKGEDVVQKNFAAVDEALAGLHEIDIPERATGATSRTSVLPSYAPEFNRKVQEPMMLGKGDELPVSALPVDGTWPVSMSRWEKRNIGIMIPEWDPDVCIQCGRCSFVCPHSTIRMKVYDPTLLADAPDGFKSADAKGKEYKGMKFTVQVAPEDCTGCRLCVATCPAKNKTNPRHRAINMALQRPIRDRERKNWDFFLSLPVQEHDQVQPTVKGSQLLQPLFEFPGACAGCGETQYIRLMSQLFGDRALVANATGCSSIYTANLPTTAFTTGEDGRGPAWANSLFEDNAEFGLGMRLALDNFESEARRLLSKLAPELSRALADEILHSGQESEFEIRTQRSRVALLKQDLAVLNAPEARSLLFLADYLVKKSVWIIGGDGWAYDIGFGGLDHVLSLGRNVNILVLDTEIYSNTGGQQSKASPLGAAAKFAASGKNRPKKDLGLMAMTYGSVYVGRVAFGADDKQTVRTFLEAESYPGTSLIIAYSHCIGHGYDLALGGSQQKLAVQSGYWPLYRFDPNRKTQGLNPLQLDSGPPTKDLSEYMYNEARYRMLRKLHPDRGAELLSEAKDRVRRQYALYEKLSRISRSQQTETA
ncbi:MAG: pyruvate:ferredoxin (flavodoxin) oxidoreductase, partial [Desulfovibrionales bacterium]